MDLVNQVMSFGKEHWVEVLAVLGGLDLILGVVTKWTPVKWDDNVYAVIHNALLKIGKK